MGQPDALVLCKSLVWEGVLPENFVKAFQEFYSAVSPAAERQRQNSAHIDNVAAGWLSEHKRQAEAREKTRPREPTLAEVIVATAGRVPKTFKSRLQRALYDTPTARQDAEEAERLRWLLALALLGKVAYTDGQSISLHASQAVLLCWAQAEEQPR